MNWYSIHRKILSGYALVMLATICLALYAGYEGEKKLVQDMGQHSGLLAEKLLDRMTGSVDHILDLMEMAALDPEVQGLVEQSRRSDPGFPGPPDPRGPEILNKKLKRLWSRKHGYDAFSSLGLWDRSGRPAAVLGGGGIQDLSRTAAWEAVGTRGTYLGHVRMDPGAGRVVLPVAVGVSDREGNFAGMMTADVLVSAVIKSVQVETPGYEYTSVRLFCLEKNQVIFSTVVSRPLAPLESLGDPTREKTGYFPGRDGGVDTLFAYARTVEGLESRGFHWGLLMGYDSREILASARAFKKNLLLGALALLLLATAGSYWISRSIVRPIRQLIQGINRVREGDLGFRVSVDSRDEAAEMARAFNQMTQGLDQAGRDLKAAQAKLESRVRQRTQELLEANQTLVREAAERATAENRFRTIFNESPLGIALIDSGTGRFLEVNKRYADIVGYSLAELMATDFQTLTHPDDLKEDLELMTRLRKKEIAFFSMEKRYLHKAGHIVWAALTVAPLWGEAPALKTHLAMVEDITRKREQEQAHLQMLGMLQQGQKMEAIGTLASGVAHEINNPINGIMNYAQLIKDTPEDAENASVFCGEIITETKRVAEIVRNLLTFSRDEKKSFSRESVNQILDAVLSLVRTIIQKDQIRLVVEVPRDLPEIFCQHQQIQQVIMNLITNARDALNEKFPGYDPAKQISIRARILEGEDLVRISVEDNGDGIPSAIHDRIFDPFFTTKDRTRGTGLGLSISYGIAREHGGGLSFVTRKGEMTRFDLDLPLMKEEKIKELP